MGNHIHSNLSVDLKRNMPNSEGRYYTEAKVDISVLDGAKSRSNFSLWRSKSTDGGSNSNSRDSRSMSRDPGREASFDKHRESSVNPRSREFSSVGRSFTPTRDYTPSREFSRRESSVMVAPPRLKKHGWYKSASNLAESSNRSSSSENANLVRSNSYHDLQAWATLRNYTEIKLQD